MARRIIVLGAPGAGKGTQAEKLARDYGIAHISTGAMFRAAVEAGSDLGKKVSGYLDAGNLVPNELTIDLVKERIQNEDCTEGFILDGFPRNLEQAEALEAALSGMSLAITHVLYFKVPKAELVRRVMERAESSGRSDDTEEVIENR
ncbi:MAG: adenylate kinase, partial [Bdellovibrionales bacterium]|nr:adenylate kinase [Bdellovibrionales bacterium]